MEPGPNAPPAKLLYRPVGLEEMRLVFVASMRAFPPRLPEQPIFYPVLSEAYAEEIARHWNTRFDARVGYVTRFAIPDAYAASFPVQTVGAREHQELWVPAEELERFNASLLGPIEVTSAFFGEGFRGLVPDRFSLKGKDAATQLAALRGIFGYSLADFHGELAANREAVFLNFPFWAQRRAADGADDALLGAIREAWSAIAPWAKLPA
jgi:hypothetical protein